MRLMCKVTVLLNHENMKRDTQIMSKFRPFINQYNWKDISFSTGSRDRKKVGTNNKKSRS